MKKSAEQELPEVIVSRKEISSSVSRLAARGKVKRIAPRLYSSNLDDDAASIVDRNLYQVLGGLFEGAVLSARS